jgi:AraC-like DNA-binding protein
MDNLSAPNLVHAPMLVERRFLPSHALLHTVVEYFQVMYAPPMTVARTIPNTRLDGWAVLEGSFQIDYDGSGRYRPVPAAGFGPMRDKPLWFRTVEGLRAVNVKCYPHLLSAAQFAPLQAGGEALGFDQIFPKAAAAQLLHVLRGGFPEEEKVRSLEMFLAQWLSEAAIGPDTWLKSVMLSMGEEAAVMDRLAARSFVSVKTLERRFQQYTGLNPKLFCKLARFQRALRDIGKNASESSTVPFLWNAGYYDQSHFIKDCRAITGLPPNRLFCQLPGLLTDIILIEGPQTR